METKPNRAAESKPKQIKIMGIINANSNSFYGGSRYDTAQKVVERFFDMLKEGADIIDLGACSTRPGSTPISERAEIEALATPLKAIAQMLEREDAPIGKWPVSISIDTFRSKVAERIYKELEEPLANKKIELIINDISAGEDDSDMLETVGRLNLGYIAMHKRGTPQTMQSLTDYSDGVVNEIKRYFEEFAKRAEKAGVKEWILDPGFGFAKTVEQNYELLEHLAELKVAGREILVGLSRKSMIYNPLNTTPDEALPQTCALNMVAMLKGADILRVHDVKEATQCRTLFELLAKSK